MRTLSLAGDWQLKDLTTGVSVPGHLPGQNYLDLMAAGAIPDPFWADNEKEASKLGGHDFLYERSFEWEESGEPVTLAVSGLDTLAKVWLNDALVLDADNAFRTWRADVTGVMRAGANRIAILFANPLAEIARRAEKIKLKAVAFGAKPAYLRKPQCHFGWDWGPNLPPCGITGSIALEVGDARLSGVRLTQRHAEGAVTLDVAPEVAAPAGRVFDVAVTVLGPDGEPVAAARSACTAGAPPPVLALDIPQPQLWWPNGLGGQPLYRVNVTLTEDGGERDEWSGRIGLRTIELETPADAKGSNFYFVVNGHRIFGKGADWIPSDTFVARTTRADLEFYVAQAARANMNMLRVWGGGYYESDDFYDLCDEYGVLVWQDFAFACSEYPLGDPQFMASVEAEVRDNVRRLRHHASLALWSGNNEVLLFLFLMSKASKARHLDFFFSTLAAWVKALDPVTPYWPGSPAGGTRKGKHAAAEDGDSHLWGVWHGMQPIEALGQKPARFCSEFGLESMPNRATVARFTDAAEPALDDPIMVAHQKSAGGNEKILYYILSKYPHPAGFDDLVYLSQLIQAEAIREATEGWRRRFGESNGALYWQYNDVWPTASWASMDSEKRPKALQYSARHFFAPVIVSLAPPADGKTRAFHAVNDRREAFHGTLELACRKLSGEPLSAWSWPVTLAPASAQQVATAGVAELLAGADPADAYLSARLVAADGVTVSRRTGLFVPDRQAHLSAPGLKAAVTGAGGAGVIELTAQSLARFTAISAPGLDLDLDDNYVDVEPGETRAVGVKLPAGVTAAELQDRLQLRSLADLPPTSQRQADLDRLRFALKPINLLTRAVLGLA